MNRSSYQVLLIEDDPADIAAISGMLHRIRNLNMKLTAKRTAAEGIQEIADANPDCVLLDYRLGETDGLDVLSQIRSQDEDVPVVFVTGEGNEYVAVEALRRGAQEYQVKSALTSKSLRQSIQSAVRIADQERLLRNQRRELEEFVSVVAHDLQQPLCAVKGNIELVRDFCSDGLDPSGREFISSAIRMTVRMSSMIDSLLSYARAGRQPSGRHPVDLNQIVEQVKNSLGELIRTRSARIDVGPLPTALADEASMHQLLQNLVANGIKFSEEQPHIEISGTLDDDECVIQVRDHGIGIAADQTDTIFGPFKRLHSRKRFEGSGIGLATCRRIVENHGGRIGVESEPGEGSSFWFALPARKESQAAGPRILIADGEAEVVRQIAAALERDGFETLSASSVQSATEILEHNTVDLLIADVSLAGENGGDLIGDVCKTAGRPSVLAMSGGSRTESPGSLLARAREAGARGVLSKPFDMERLIGAVRSVMDGSASISAPPEQAEAQAEAELQT